MLTRSLALPLALPLALVLAVAIPARGQTVTVTTGAPSDYIGETNHNQLFGIENFAPWVTNWTPSTLGQTFTVPTTVDRLDSFSFWLFNYEAAAHVRMHASIFAWNVAAATEGTELWSSGEFFGPHRGWCRTRLRPGWHWPRRRCTSR